MFSSCEENRPHVLQAIAHLYRGEMNRLTIYRQRLDITSTWCITMVSAFLIFYFGDHVSVHFALFPILPIFAFSLQESRRYRYYRLIQRRIECLEKGFFIGDIFCASTMTSDEIYHWRQQLLSSFSHPTHDISFLRAWTIRFFRNYIWMIYILILAWFSKRVQFVDTFYNTSVVQDSMLYFILTFSSSLFIFHILFIIYEYYHTMDIDI